jgi:glutamate/tyrosine decarboxylase-like PLP-dependent enzyme
MSAAFWWGVLASATLFLGQALARPLARSPRITGLIMGFGAGTLQSAIAYELVPESNIVCYRHRPKGVVPGAELDAHNRALRRRVVEDGRFYIVGTELPGGYYLRSTIMNPLIQPSDFDELLAHLRELCRA